jgi:DNA-binding IclR family transcriptional regulator
LGGKATAAPSLTIQSVERGLKLLEFIALQPDGCNVKWLSKVSGINLSTCYHLLNTLDFAGYIEKDNSQNYVLSYKVSYLNNLVQNRRAFPQRMVTTARSLVQNTRETAYVATWENGEVVVSYIAESEQAVKVRSLYVGYRDHAFVRALGKAILAYVSPHELQVYKDMHVPEQTTRYSKISWSEIDEELKLTRERGYSLDEEEYQLEVCCIGAPVFKFDGSIWGAISISMPSNRYDPANMTTIDYLIQEADTASQSLGYKMHLQKEGQQS